MDVKEEAEILLCILIAQFCGNYVVCDSSLCGRGEAILHHCRHRAV